MGHSRTRTLVFLTVSCVAPCWVALGCSQSQNLPTNPAASNLHAELDGEITFWFNDPQFKPIHERSMQELQGMWLKSAAGAETSSPQVIILRFQNDHVFVTCFGKSRVKWTVTRFEINHVNGQRVLYPELVIFNYRALRFDIRGNLLTIPKGTLSSRHGHAGDVMDPLDLSGEWKRIQQPSPKTLPE